MPYPAIAMNEMTCETADTSQIFLFVTAEYESNPNLFEIVFPSIEDPVRLSRGPILVPFETASTAQQAYRRMLADIEINRPHGMLIEIELIGCGANQMRSYN